MKSVLSGCSIRGTDIGASIGTLKEHIEAMLSADRFLIEKISDFFKFRSPWLFMFLIAIVTDILFIYVHIKYNGYFVDKILSYFFNEVFWWNIIAFYSFLILSYYRNNFVYLVKKFKSEGLISEKYQIKLLSITWRLVGYTVCLIYFIFILIYEFKFSDWFGYNLIEKIAALMYVFAFTAILVPMGCDVSGIIPKVWGFSKDIFENTELKINLFHADKHGGLKPLENFVFILSLLIGLPFIIGMPIHVLTEFGSLTLTITDALTMVSLGAIIASSMIFFKSNYYIYRKIEEFKTNKLNEISKELMECYIRLEHLHKEKLNEVEINLISNRINFLDNEINKINEVKMAPWGANRVKEFYTIILLPTITTILIEFLKLKLQISTQPT